MDRKSWELLIAFVGKFWTVRDMELSESTRLQEDLGIKGDDADIFMFEFSKQFNVNIDSLDLPVYFEGYNDDIFTVILKAIRKKYGGKTRKRDTLTLNDLMNGILAGKLDERILMEGRHNL